MREILTIRPELFPTLLDCTLRAVQDYGTHVHQLIAQDCGTGNTSHTLSQIDWTLVEAQLHAFSAVCKDYINGKYTIIYAFMCNVS